MAHEEPKLLVDFSATGDAHTLPTVPEFDIAVQFSRHVEPVIPAVPAAELEDPLVAESLYCLATKTKAVRHKQDDYKQLDEAKVVTVTYRVDEENKKPDAADAGQANRALSSDLFNAPTEKKQVEETPIDLNLIKDNTYAKTSAHIDGHPSANQEIGLFCQYHPTFKRINAEVEVVKREPTSMWREVVGRQVLLECRQLQFGFPQFEPLFCSLALYDLKEETRLTEFMYFDMNTVELLQGLKNHDLSDPCTSSKRAVLTISELPAPVHVVLRIERVLQGDPDAANEIYTREKGRSPADIEKLRKKLQPNLTRLGAYRQPFAFGAINVGALLSGEADDPVGDHGLVIDKLYPLKQSLDEKSFLKLVSELQDEPGKKLKPLMGASFSFDVKQLPDHIPFTIVDPTYSKLKPPMVLRSESQSQISQQQQQPVEPRMSEMKNPDVKDTTPKHTAAAVASPASTASATTPTLAPIPSPSGKDQPNPTPRLSTPVGSRHAAPSNAGASGKVDMKAEKEKAEKDSANDIVREIASFPPDSSIQPYCNLVNTLYVLPVSGSFTKHRNIACVVQLRNTDSAPEPNAAAGMLNDPPPAGPAALSPTPARPFYGKSSGPRFTACACTQVNWHVKQPTWQDEIKLALPVQLSSRTHLLFTFYQINCQLKKDTQPTQELVGFSYLPLYAKSRFLPDGLHQLQVASKLGSGYLTKPADAVEWSQQNFNVRLHLVSSIYHQDPAISSLTAHFPSDADLDKNPAAALDLVEKNVARALPQTQVLYLAPIMRYLLKIIANRPPAAQQAAFLALTQTAISVEVYVNEEQDRCSLLSSYATHMFDNPDGKPVYTQLAENFHRLLANREKHEKKDEQGALLKCSWFVMELIFKSMACHLAEEKDSARVLAEQAEFSRAMEPLLVSFAEQMTKHRCVGLTVVKRLNHAIGQLFCDLFSVMPRGSVIHLLDHFLQQVDRAAEPVLFEIKMTFLRILLDGYDPFSHNPTGLEKDKVDPRKTDVINLLQDHFKLISLTINAIDNSWHLAKHASGLLEQMICVLRDWMAKQDYDARHQSLADKAHVASMCLPLLPTLCASQQNLLKSGESAQRSLLMCVLFVLRHAPKHLLKAWWTAADEETLDSFFQLLDLACALFEYAGYDVRSKDKEFCTILAPESSALFLEAVLNTAANLKSNLESMLSNVHNKSRTLKRGALRVKSMRTHTCKPESVAVGEEGAAMRQPSISIPAGGAASPSTGRSTPNEEPSIPAAVQESVSEHSASPVGPQGGAATGSSPAQTPTGLAASPSGMTASAKQHKLRAARREKMAAVNACGSPGSMQVAQQTTVPSIALSSAVSSPSLLSTQAGHQARSPSMNSINIDGTGTLSQNRSFTKLGRLTLRRNRTQKTIADRDGLMHLLSLEGALAETVSRTVISTVLDFIALFPQYTDPAKASLLAPTLLRLVSSLVQGNHADSLYLVFYPMLLCFIKVTARALFSQKKVDPVLTDVTKELIRHCSYTHQQIRVHAVSALYTLAAENFSATRALDWLQAATTMGLNQTVARLHGQGPKCLQASLQAVAAFAKADKTQTEQFRQALEPVLARAHVILNDTLEICRLETLGNAVDAAAYEDMLIGMADAYSHLPTTRIDWLTKLAEHHQKHNNNAEAGFCYVEIARLVKHLMEIKAEEQADSAVRRGSLTKKKEEEKDKQEGDQKEAQKDDDTGTSQTVLRRGRSSLTLMQRLTKALSDACAQFDKADLFEQCNETYMQLLPLWQKAKDWQQLSACHEHLHTVFEKLIQAEATQSRMLGTYYRVGFYGEKFGKTNDGQEFIYKMPKITQLSEIVDRLKTLYSNQTKVPVQIFQYSGQVPTPKPDECVLQITFVSPNFTPEQLKTRTDFIDKNTDITMFKFSTPFTKGGKGAHGSLQDQMKKTVICHVPKPFPWFVTRQKVVKKEETVLSPVQSATEDVEKRIQAMQDIIQRPDADANSLKILLQGSILMQVNGGIKDIAVAFLGARPEKSPDQPNPERLSVGNDSDQISTPTSFAQAHLSALRQALRQFLETCSEGLTKNEGYCESGNADDKLQQEEFMKAYQQLRAEMAPLIQEGAVTRRKRQQRASTDSQQGAPTPTLQPVATIPIPQTTPTQTPRGTPQATPRS